MPSAAEAMYPGGPSQASGPQTLEGMLEPGNIDLSKRKPIQHGGGRATVRSISVEMDGKHYLLPTVIGDKVVGTEEAVQYFKKTGQHLGVFGSSEAADKAGQLIHEQEAERISK
jgi:hypothetical protein